MTSGSLADPLSIPELPELSIIEAARMLRHGDLTATAYAEALLDRCMAAKGLNALVAQDADAVRAAAARADEHRRAGRALGPLHGVPLVLKDNFDTVGLATTGGTPGLRGNRPRRNAAAAQKLIDAGAIVLGKANLHELCFGATSNNPMLGAARNPYAPDRIPGGSSGGTGAAVAARMAPGGLGSDTGGSVRIPAALCGVVGFRPTVGRWSQAGMVPISPTRDTAGPLARTVADCALLDGIATGGPAAVTPANLQGLRLGVPRGFFWENVDLQTGRILDEALARLADAGAVLVEGDIPEVERLNYDAGMPIAGFEPRMALGAYLIQHEIGIDYDALVAGVLSPDVRALLAQADGVTEAQYRDALQVHRPAMQEIYRRHFQDLRVAAVLFPTTPLPAARIGEDETVLMNGMPQSTLWIFTRNVSPASVAGIPGLSVPAGLTAAGLPVGLELDGPAMGDADLLAIGAAVEAVMPKIRPPTLS